MKKIVQKFGGTSLDTDKKREKAASKVNKARKSGLKPIVVVSAMGRLGDPYATDTLISKAEQVIPEIDPREKDLLMSCGEVVSSVIMVQYLKKIGLPAVALTGALTGITTDEKFGEANVKKVKPEGILQVIKKNKIPVIAGFQGVSSDGNVTTLGRGGSDTTASIIAVAIEALFIEIFTDVEGVMTADPALVEKAKVLNEVSYNEVCELAYQGARVIHPRAAEIAKDASIPIKVNSIFNDRAGSIIHDEDMRSVAKDRPITGVASRKNVIFVKISPEDYFEYATGLKVFKVLAEKDISVDFINIRPEGISFVIDEKKQGKLINILEDNNFKFKIRDDLIKIALVGGGMTGQPGVIAKIVETLSKENISIYQTTDSHTTISCLIKREKEKKALNTLHEAFSLEN
jgi:aspartate kinase